MKTLGSAVTATALLCAGVFQPMTVSRSYATSDKSRSHASDGNDDRRPQSAETAPPPVVDGRATKDGLQLGARANDEGRLPGKQKPSKAANPTKRGSSRHPRTFGDKRYRNTPARHDDFRLNIGICGAVGADGTFPGPTRCQPFVGDPPGRRPEVEPTGGVVVQVPRAQDVRWEAILSAYKNVLFAALKVKVQPEGRTLVRWETNVYTEQARVTTKTVELLGFPVVVEATPVSYTWDFGDGGRVTTASPGRPYPGKDVTHKYLKRGDVGVFVTTNYAARFNVDGTGWQYVEGTVGIAGPATGLLVREGVPVLVDPPG